LIGASNLEEVEKLFTRKKQLLSVLCSHNRNKVSRTWRAELGEQIGVA
jgi:hypothetical protein